MNFLVIADPIRQLKPKTDTTLALVPNGLPVFSRGNFVTYGLAIEMAVKKHARKEAAQDARRYGT